MVAGQGNKAVEAAQILYGIAQRQYAMAVSAEAPWWWPETWRDAVAAQRVAAFNALLPYAERLNVAEVMHEPVGRYPVVVR